MAVTGLIQEAGRLLGWVCPGICKEKDEEMEAGQLTAFA